MEVINQESCNSEEVLYLKVCNALDMICTRVKETLSKQQQQVEASRKKCEIESRVAHQLQLHEELSARLKAEQEHVASLEQVCSDIQNKLSIANTDQARLNQARDMYQIAKELTGVRWDFTTGPDVVKGYVKSSVHKVLEAFEVAPGAEDALWGVVSRPGRPLWEPLQVPAKENMPRN